MARLPMTRGGVAVGGHGQSAAMSTSVDGLALEQPRDGGIGDELVAMPRLAQLPGGQAGALHEGPGLGHDDAQTRRPGRWSRSSAVMPGPRARPTERRGRHGASTPMRASGALRTRPTREASASTSASGPRASRSACIRGGDGVGLARRALAASGIAVRLGPDRILRRRPSGRRPSRAAATPGVPAINAARRPPQLLSRACSAGWARALARGRAPGHRRPAAP